MSGKYLLLIVALFGGTMATAETDKEMEAYLAQLPKPETIIPAVVEKYASALGCSYAFDPRNIIEYEIKRKRSFLVMFQLDVGCSGGNASHGPVFAVLQYGAYDKIFIQPEYSAPAQTSGKFPMQTDRIWLDSGRLYYSAHELDAAKDPLCCPSIDVSGEFAYSKGSWQPVD
jgi:hypothetical protein